MTGVTWTALTLVPRELGATNIAFDQLASSGPKRHRVPEEVVGKPMSEFGETDAAVLDTLRFPKRRLNTAWLSNAIVRPDPSVNTNLNAQGSTCAWWPVNLIR